MPPVTLKPVEDLMPQVERVLNRTFARLKMLVPYAVPHHVGATAIPGALTKGDVDVLLRVSREQFPIAVGVLREHFSIKQPDNWTPEFASFGDDASLELPLGIQVAVVDSRTDFLLFLRDHFILHPDALNQYNRLKLAYAVEGPEAYWRAKHEFLARILTQRKVQHGPDLDG